MSSSDLYAGIDRSDYPGNDFMQALMQNTNLLWTGFYLGPTPCHGGKSWMETLTDLRSMSPGWGIAPLYVGQQHSSDPNCSKHVLTADQGSKDGSDAIKLANQAGFKNDSVIYLDIEIGGNLESNYLEYVNAWCQAIRSDDTYRPGVYCSHFKTATQLSASNPDLLFWVFNLLDKYQKHQDDPDVVFVALDEFRKPDMAECRVPFASVWQWIQNFAKLTTTLPDGSSKTVKTWDLDVSTLPDPSMPERTFDSDTNTWNPPLP